MGFVGTLSSGPGGQSKESFVSITPAEFKEFCRLKAAKQAQVPAATSLSACISQSSYQQTRWILDSGAPFTLSFSSSGGRIIISSDGVWDALSAEKALECCRGMLPEAAAEQIVKEAVQFKGLRDDTTCIVVDVLPQAKPSVSLQPPKKPGKGVFKCMFRKKPSESSQKRQECIEPIVVEELYEEGSAMLSERLNTKYPLCNMFRLFTCAVCQVEIKPGEGISIHAALSNPGKFRPWDGPFLCLSCQEKKEAMEGKRPS